ncbi:MAG: riboflavin synthase [Actinobacteria bacterium]|nr:riboflavin synthase [Actinomycetota bacterium]
MSPNRPTGIVEELGKVGERSGSRLRFSSQIVLDGSKIGSSIAVNGCCLTVVDLDQNSWMTDVSDETFSRTNLGSLKVGDVVNLERPMALGDRLGGHLVLGHVDAVGEIVSEVPNLVVRIPRDLMHLIVEKGSVTVDGISLTAYDLTVDTFSVAVIPHTTEVTTLGVRKVGDKVNIEMDMVAKHIARVSSTAITAQGTKSKKWWRR